MSTLKDGPAWEQVVAVDKFHDAPRTGVALFRGQPHAFAAEFSYRADDYTELHILTPLTEEAAERAVERQIAWRRWWDHPRGPTTGPATDIPKEWAAFHRRYGDSFVRADPQRCVVARAEFRAAIGLPAGYIARWHLVGESEPGLPDIFGPYFGASQLPLREREIVPDLLGRLTRRLHEPRTTALLAATIDASDRAFDRFHNRLFVAREAQWQDFFARTDAAIAGCHAALENYATSGDLTVVLRELPKIIELFDTSPPAEVFDAGGDSG